MAGSGSALFPAPSQPPAPLPSLALGTWHSLPPESRAALPAGRSSPRQPGPLRRRRQRHLPRGTGTRLSVRGWGGRAGGGARGAADWRSRERGSKVRPASAPCYGTLGGTRFISRKVLARKQACLVVAPLVARGREKAAAEKELGADANTPRFLSQVVRGE